MGLSDLKFYGGIIAIALLAPLLVIVLARLPPSRKVRRPPASAQATAPERPRPLPTPAAEVELETLVKGGGNTDVRFAGALHVKGRSTFPEGLIVDGSLTVADGSELNAVVEVRGDATLGAKARVVRPVLVRGNLILGPGARIPAGHVEGDVIMLPGAVVDSYLHCRALYLDEAKPSQA